MELARFVQWLGDLWSFGFPKRGLKVRLSGHKASHQPALHDPFFPEDYWASESVLMENLDLDGYFVRPNSRES